MVIFTIVIGRLAINIHETFYKGKNADIDKFFDWMQKDLPFTVFGLSIPPTFFFFYLAMLAKRGLL
jgi:hypothetical protein